MKDGVEYQSLRLKGEVHRLRFGSGAKLVEANGDQKITFFSEPFELFRITPGGLEIPLHNVASAIPKGAALTSRLRKTSQTGGRLGKGDGDADE